MTDKATFKYAGSNANITAEIKRFIPPVDCQEIDDFTEAFCGTAVLTLNKERHDLETLNDLNGEVVNFLEQLRDNRQELVKAIEFTPYARQELVAAYSLNNGDNAATSPIEQARKFYVRQMQSRNGADEKPYWKRQFKSRGNDNKIMKVAARSFADTEHLEVYGRRLCGVQIEQMDAIKFLKEYGHNRALHYIDPPFLPETRENKDRLYRHEMTEDQHHNLLTAVSGLTFAIVRHYACEMYDDMLLGFARFDFSKRVDGKGGKVESLYVSPFLMDLLDELQPLQSVEQLRIL